MTKAQLVSQVAQKASLIKRDADKAVDAVVEVVGDTLSTSGYMRIDGLGVFKYVPPGWRGGNASGRVG